VLSKLEAQSWKMTTLFLVMRAIYSGFVPELSIFSRVLKNKHRGVSQGA
jgi:hypothetical protein